MKMLGPELPKTLQQTEKVDMDLVLSTIRQESSQY
jgi:hypothetical protein